jgi:hypothetical protein
MKSQGVIPLSYYDLIEMFPQPGCVICNLLLKAADQFLDNLLYERVLEQETHTAMRRRRGLCSTHSQRAIEFKGSSVSLAILYKTVLDEILTEIKQTSAEPIPKKSGLGQLFSTAKDLFSLAARLEPKGRCVACDAVDESERRYVHALNHHIGDARMRAAYQGSNGLCVPHFRMVIREANDPILAREIISIQQSMWAQLKDELQEFIDKSDYRRGREVAGSEAGSWLRAAMSMAGEKDIFGLDSRGE